MVDKLYAFIGLIQRSGNLTSGNDGVEGDIKRGKCQLLIISTDASENTKKKFENMAKLHNTNYVYYGKKSEIGRSIGKSERSVISIRDKNFADGFIGKYKAESVGGESIVKNKDI